MAIAGAQVPHYAGINIIVVRINAAVYGSRLEVSMRNQDGSPAELADGVDKTAAIAKCQAFDADNVSPLPPTPPAPPAPVLDLDDDPLPVFAPDPEDEVQGGPPGDSLQIPDQPFSDAGAPSAGGSGVSSPVQPSAPATVVANPPVSRPVAPSNGGGGGGGRRLLQAPCGPISSPHPLLSAPLTLSCCPKLYIYIR
jgi:hypothetical protein